MPINEQQAVQLLQVRGSITDPARLQQADALLKTYRDNQEQEGLPPFPSLLAQQEQDKQDFHELFANPNKVAEISPQAQQLLAQSPDPENDKKRVVNVKYLARKTGRPEADVWESYPQLSAAYAKQVWNKPVAGDGDFFALANADVQKDIAREKRQQDAANHALVAASDTLTVGGMESFKEWKAKTPDADDSDTAFYMNAYGRFLRDTYTQRHLVEKLSTGLTKYMQGFDVGAMPEDAVNQLLALPPKQRNSVVAAIAARAKTTGEASDKSMVWETGEAFARTLTDMFGGEAYRDAVYGLAVDRLDTTTAPEGATPKDIERAALADADKRVVAADAGMTSNVGEERKLTADEKKAFALQVENTKRGFQLARQVQNIMRTADPVKSALASGLGSSMALMGIIALPGGSSVSAIGYANTEYNNLRLTQPQMSEGAAMGISLFSGAFDMALDKLEFSFLSGKMPSMRDLVNKGVAYSAVKRGLIRGTETLTFEQWQEGAQDITTPVVQDIASRLSTDIPAVDWKAAWSEWAKQRPDVLVGTLPLTLLGVGVAHVQDMKGAGAMLQDRKALQLVGIPDNDIVEIVDATAKGDLQTAETLLQNAFTRRDPKIAEAAGATVEQVNAAEAGQQFQKLVERGIMPEIKMAEDGFTLTTPNGLIQKAATWDEAKMLMDQHFNDFHNKDIDLVAQMGGEFMKQKPAGVSETVEISGETRTDKEDIQQGVVSVEDSRTAAVSAGIALGLDEDEAARQMTAVLGRNITKTRGMIAQSATALYRGANALTVTEEVVHGRWDAGLASGRYTEQQGREWVEQAETATGMKFMHGTTALDLKEAISAIVVADVLGQRKTDESVGGSSGFNSPGIVTNSMLDAVKRQASDGTLSAMVQAFRQFFKQVFQAAKALRQAKTDGKLDSSFQAMLDDLVGVNRAEALANQAAVEASDIARFENEGGTPAYSRAPAQFHERIDTELAKALKDPAKRRAYYTEARNRVGGVARNLEREAIMARGDVHDNSERPNPEREYEALRKAADELAKKTQAKLEGLGVKPKEAKQKAAATAREWLKSQIDAFMVGGSQWTERARQSLQREAKTREAFAYDSLLKKQFGADTTEKQAKLPAVDRNAARAEAKGEAERWLKDELAKIPTPEERHHEALRVLDAAAMAFPKEMRAQFGSFAEWDKARTDTARVNLLQRKLEKVSNAVERELKKELTQEVKDLLNRGRPDYSAGDAPKSDIGPDGAYLFKKAYEASKMSAGDLARRMAQLDSDIASGTLTPEQEDLAMAEVALIERVGDIKNQDAATLETGLAMLQDIYKQGAFQWMLEHGARVAAMKQLADDFKAGTSKTGSKEERSQAKAYAETRYGIGRNMFLRLSSYSEVLHYLLSNDSPLARQLVDRERNASNSYHDAMNGLEQRIEDFFTARAGGVVQGQKMRYAMSLQSINAFGLTGKLSQMQAIQAMLMWAQPDGRRHMEGVKDANGDVVSSWSYDQSWIDAVAKQMTPEAEALMQFISNDYAKEWSRINEAYRERFGVDLPQIDRYAPLTVVPHKVSSSGMIVDPVTGVEMSGNVTHPGFIRTRGKFAVAEPDFKDALQVFIGHNRQVEYCLYNYDVAKQLESLARDREVRNTISAVAGEEGVRIFEEWSQVISQGGFRDNTAASEVNKVLSKLVSNAASAAILGRISTLVVQSTQLAAAAVQMPLGSYMGAVGKAMAGELNLADAFHSPFIQRRMNAMPPLVRQALATLNTSEPNILRHQIYNLGRLLGGADALFTTFTYAAILDYQRGQAKEAGLTGQAAEDMARNEAERMTEEVAQPIRNSTRSLYELQTRNPMARAMWAFASESRQKVALTAWALANRDKDGARAAKVAFLTFVINGLFTQVFKNAWREAKGDDDKRKWDWTRLLTATLLNPLGGIPGVSAFTDTGSMFSGPERAMGAVRRVLTGKESLDVELLHDLELILQGAAVFNEDAAALSALSHAGFDFAHMLGNLVH